MGFTYANIEVENLFSKRTLEARALVLSCGRAVAGQRGSAKYLDRILFKR